jgi:type IV fimbrial biogenesis protein FimT
MKKYTEFSPKFSPKHSQGFTLIELLLTVLVLSVVLSIGIPSFKGTIQNARLTAQTNETIGTIALARSEASKRPNTTITLCASTNTTSANPACNSSAWENGWFMMSDVDADRTFDPATDQVLRVYEPLAGDNTLRTVGFTNSDFLQFDSTGIPDSAGTFIICDDRGDKKAKAIALSVIGHARIAVDEGVTLDGIVNNHLGVNVSCP